MDRWLATLSKNTIAFLAIGGGILFIVLSDPPKSVCDAQVDVFKQSQTGFLFLDKTQKAIKTTGFEKALALCKRSNSPGGCYELFHGLRGLKGDLRQVPSECSGDVGGLSAVKKALWEGLGLMVRLAWGEKAPVSYHQKFAWLDTSDVYLYCSMKQNAQQFYGKSQWQSFVEKQFQTLPGADKMPRKQAWASMILSVNCAQY